MPDHGTATKHHAPNRTPSQLPAHASPHNSSNRHPSGTLLPACLGQVKMMWDAQWLWVGAWLAEPQLVASITTKNAVIYHDNDFEVGCWQHAIYMMYAMACDSKARRSSPGGLSVMQDLWRLLLRCTASPASI